MKLKEFLKDDLSISPGSVKLSIKSQREKYREKYDALVSDASKKFHSDSYRVSPGGRVIVHIKVPSQSLHNFHYDVLFELTPTDHASQFEECDFKLFSNSPSFVYGGYAYVFYHLDTNPNKTGSKKHVGMMIDAFKHKIPRDRLLMPSSEKKLGKDAVSEEPVIRNPMGIPIPDSSTYFAIFYLTEELRFDQVMSNHNNRTERQIFDNVSDFDHLMVLRKRQLQKERHEADKIKKKEARKVSEKLNASRIGSATNPKFFSAPTQISGRGITRPRTSRGKTGGVNRIG